MLIFLHIGRSAGLTLRPIIKHGLQSLKNNTSLYLDVPWKNPNKTISNWIGTNNFPPIFCNAHYVGFGVHRKIDRTYKIKSKYFTMIREPLSRSVSILSSGRGGWMFNGEKENINMVLFGKIPNNITDTEKIRINHARTDNVITRTLGCKNGEISFDNSDKCSSVIFERAINNITKVIDLVLLTEKFDESVLLMKKKYNLLRPYYYKINKKVKNKSSADFTDEQIEFIHNRDKYDFKLYAIAEKIIEKKIKLNFKNFDKELNQYRIKNKIYGSMLYYFDHISPKPLFGDKQLLLSKYKVYKNYK